MASKEQMRTFEEVASVLRSRVCKVLVIMY